MLVDAFSSHTNLPPFVRGMMFDFDVHAWSSFRARHATDVAIVVSPQTWPAVYDFFQLSRFPVTSLRNREDVSLPFSLLASSPEASWSFTHEDVRVVLYPEGLSLAAFPAELLYFSDPKLWGKARRYWVRGLTEYIGPCVKPVDLERSEETLPLQLSKPRIGIIGGGVAGASVAKACLQKGLLPLVFDKHGAPAQSASALYAALFHEHRQGDGSPLGTLTALGAAWMRKQSSSAVEPCGVLDICRDSDWTHASCSQRETLLSRYPLSPDEVKARWGWRPPRPARWYDDAGILYLGAWTRECLKSVIWVGQTEVRWAPYAGAWGIWRTDQKEADAPAWIVDKLFLTMGAEGVRTLDAPLPLTAVSGQIALGLETDAPCGPTGVTGDAYWVQVPGFEGVGATFEVGDRPSMSLEEAYAHNREMGHKLTGLMKDKCFLGTYRGVRAVSHDRLPWCGPMPDTQVWQGMHFKARPEAKQIPLCPDLYVLMGLGSRGATWGGVLGEEVVRQALALPPLLSEKLQRAVSPARDWARAFTQGEPKQ